MVSQTTALSISMFGSFVNVNIKFGVRENLGGGLYGNFMWIWGIQYFIICGMILNDIKKSEPVNTVCDHDQKQYFCSKLKKDTPVTSKNVTFSWIWTSFFTCDTNRVNLGKLTDAMLSNWLVHVSTILKDTP